MKEKLLVAFVMNDGKIYVGKSPNNDLKKGKVVMQETIIIKSSRDLSEGNNVKERIAKTYFNFKKKKGEKSFGFDEYKTRYELL